MIYTLVDIVAFFGWGNIHDVMQTLHEIGVNKKVARVQFKLNEGTEIAVKTAGESVTMPLRFLVIVLSRG